MLFFFSHFVQRPVNCSSLITYLSVSRNLHETRKSPEFLIAFSLTCTFTRLQCISSSNWNRLFFEHLMDTLQPTLWLFPHLSHPNPASVGLFSTAVATLKASCPKGRFSLLSPRCFAWSYTPAGLLLERVPSPFGFLALPTMEGGKYLVLCSTGCGGIKGRNQSLLVTREHLICQKQPAQLGFPFQAACDDSEYRVDNELFMSRSCLFTLLQRCEWLVHEKHPALWPLRGNLSETTGWEPIPPPLQRKMHCLLTSRAIWELTLPQDCIEDTTQQSNEHVLVAGSVF